MLPTDNKTTINTRHFKYCISDQPNSYNRSPLKQQPRDIRVNLRFIRLKTADLKSSYTFSFTTTAMIIA